MNLRATPAAALDMADVERIVHGRHGDPFSVLGLHRDDTGPLVRAFLPDALAVTVYDRGTGAPLGALGQVDTAGLYAGRITAAVPYVLRIDYPGGARWETEDPYSFGPLLSDEALARFADGDELDPAASLGAHVTTVEGVDGTRFAVWAPNASRVAVVGDFNAWDPRRHPMRLRHRAGIWELFVPRLGPGDRYKYQIIAANGEVLPLKADPYARRSEAPPATASIIADPAPFAWSDREWMEGRAARQGPEAPMAIYEVHPGSWLHGEHGQALDWDGLAARLLPYVREMGFTHVEFMPITEYPFGGSWGYQPLGLYAPTARFGTPDGFARLVDNFHAAGIGVILDWVPGHFPNDPHGLAWFDGSALYEHADPREGFHPDWNSCVYNLGRNEVISFLLGSALYWLDTFHIDGLRVDAVASMLYRDYSRAAGAWIPNIYGGRENLEAIAFLRRLNWTVQARCPGAVTIAEESTAWPGVTRPVEQDGLGFSFKWNMGWMHDTLRYMAREPIYRRYHHDDMTFGLLYAFSERFVLPLSHDEVVHGKGSLLAKMPGDRWQQLAGLRAYLAFMWAHPGKKVLFMGSEIAQQAEWNHDAELEWYRLDDPGHRGVQRLVRDLNRLYAAEPALYARDCEDSSFQWLVQDDRDNSIFAFLRHGDDGTPPVMAVVNMTPMPRHGYRIGLPAGGWWAECLNSDAAVYGGSNVGNGGGVGTEAVPSHGFGLSAVVTVPPLATLLFRLENEA